MWAVGSPALPACPASCEYSSTVQGSPIWMTHLISPKFIPNRNATVTKEVLILIPFHRFIDYFVSFMVHGIVHGIV